MRAREEWYMENKRIKSKSSEQYQRQWESTVKTGKCVGFGEIRIWEPCQRRDVKCKGLRNTYMREV